MRVSSNSDSLSTMPFQHAAGVTKRALAAGDLEKTQTSPTTPDALPASKVSATEASISWRRMSFDVDLNSRSIRVTVSDRNSGEVYRELVYDRSGLLHLPGRPDAGRWIDRAV